VIELLAKSLVPIFVGLLFGYAAGLRKVVDNKDVRTLVGFLMTFALPCYLFVTMASTPRQLLWAQAKPHSSPPGCLWPSGLRHCCRCPRGWCDYDHPNYSCNSGKRYQCRSGSFSRGSHPCIPVECSQEPGILGSCARCRCSGRQIPRASLC